MFALGITQVGGVRVRGISGGERKRLAVGMELVTSPSLLMLDEPTSGAISTTGYFSKTIG